MSTKIPEPPNLGPARSRCGSEAALADVVERATLRQRVDMHVHSKHSGRFKLFVLASLEVEECYTEPRAIYDTMLARGMSMVTITDHDTLDGGLEIAHLPGVFLSEEISARFPENGCIVHVLAYGIDEARHREIQRLRYNVYELAAYLRRERILHSLAHPFSSANQRLTPELLVKSLLLFDTLELVNGQKDPSHERFVREVVTKVDARVLGRWADRHALDVDLERRWCLTAGSDDHSGVTMARAYVEFDGPPTLDALAGSIRSGRASARGLDETCTSYAHTAWVGTIKYFRHTHREGGSQTFTKLADFVRTKSLPAGPMPPVLARLVPAALATMAENDAAAKASWLVDEAHTPEAHEELYAMIHSTLLRAFRASFAAIKSGAEKMDLEPIIDELPTLLRLALFNLPYYFGFRFFYGERRRARALYDTLALEDAIEPERRVALFCDTLDNVDGVSIGLRRAVRELRQAGRVVHLCGVELGDALGTSEDDVVRFPTIGSFPLLGYDSYTLGWPSLVEVLRWLDRNEIDLVVATTPGPVGLVAMLAARILGIPIVGQYHTHLPEYAARLVGDRSIGRLVEGYTSWFYGAMAEVSVPSWATRETLARQGVPVDRVRVVRRGVDTRAFHPRRRDPDFWRRRGLSGGTTLLYAGRVSREKNVGFLAETFLRARAEGIDVELAVVGDGPWAEPMQRMLAGHPVAFTGYLHGEELATAFASADLLVFPSTTDTFGNVVLEALASGTPALVTDVGGPAEIVHHAETGTILPAGDHAAWIAEIRRLAADDDALARMRRLARMYAVECSFVRARDDQWSFYAGHIDRFRAALREDIR
jgi:glycosyltransferase involved in cell wall biosynthesis